MIKYRLDFEYYILVCLDFEWAIKLNRLTLNMIGVWPNVQDDGYSSDVRVVSCLFLFVFMGIVPAIHSLIRTWGDMIAIIDNLQFTLPLLTTIMKLVIVRWKKTGNSSRLNSRDQIQKRNYRIIR